MSSPNTGFIFNPLSANPTKWSNTLKQFVGNLSKNCLSVFDQYVGLALKGLTLSKIFSFKAAIKSIAYGGANFVPIAVSQICS